MDINNFELEVLGLNPDGPNTFNLWTIKLTDKFKLLQLECCKFEKGLKVA